MQPRIKNLVVAAIIAALYTVLTVVFAPLASGVIQVRIAEALTVLPAFTPAAIPGLFIGCLVSGFIGGNPIDALAGSGATLIAAILTYFIGKKCRSNKTFWICTLPPIVINAIVVPLILEYAYHLEGGVWFFVLTVACGQAVAAGLLGCLLYKIVKKIDIL